MTRDDDDQATAGDDVPSDLVAQLVLRAGRLGFSRFRVATALGLSADDLASIATRRRRHEHAQHPVRPAIGLVRRSRRRHPQTVFARLPETQDLELGAHREPHATDDRHRRHRAPTGTEQRAGARRSDEPQTGSGVTGR